MFDKGVFKIKNQRSGVQLQAYFPALSCINAYFSKFLNLLKKEPKSSTVVKSNFKIFLRKDCEV